MLLSSPGRPRVAALLPDPKPEDACVFLLLELRAGAEVAGALADAWGTLCLIHCWP